MYKHYFLIIISYFLLLLLQFRFWPRTVNIYIGTGIPGVSASCAINTTYTDAEIIFRRTLFRPRVRQRDRLQQWIRRRRWWWWWRIWRRARIRWPGLWRFAERRLRDWRWFRLRSRSVHIGWRQRHIGYRAVGHDGIIGHRAVWTVWPWSCGLRGSCTSGCGLGDAYYPRCEQK